MIRFQKHHRWISLVLLFSLLSLIIGTATGCGGSGTTPSGGTDGKVKIDLSPNGPTYDQISIRVGGLSSGQPDSSGNTTLSPPSDTTCTIFALDQTTKKTLLMAVSPPGSTSNGTQVPINARTTALALLFFHSCGWMVNQEGQASFLADLEGVQAVQDFISALSDAYNQDGWILIHLFNDQNLVDKFQKALDAIPDVIAKYSILKKSRLKDVSRSIALNTPTSANGVELSVDSSDAITAANSKKIDRNAIFTDQAGLISPATTWIPAEGSAQLRPYPLPNSVGEFSIQVTGGLKDWSQSDYDVAHIVPVGVTISADIICPLISCIIGVKQLASDEEVVGSGKPLRDYFMSTFIFEGGNISDIKPIPKLIKDIAEDLADGQANYAKDIGDWAMSDLLPAVFYSMPDLINALSEQYGLQLVSALAKEGIAAAIAPEIVAIYKATSLAIAVSEIILTVVDLETPADTYFTGKQQTGDISIVIH